jgi:TolA-binding protein
VRALLFAACLLSSAPYQCATDRSERPVEDTAPQALWILAERFEAEGNQAARETTLQQLLQQYPSSRYAQRAREELGIADPANRSAPKP